MSRLQGCRSGCPGSNTPNTRTAAPVSGVTSAATSAQAIVIVGDTAAAVRYAARLLALSRCSSTALPIYLIVEGDSIADNSAITNIEDSTFAVTTYNQALHYLQRDTINPVLTPAEDETVVGQPDRSFDFYYGTGPLGDFVSAYILPRVGGWFSEANNKSNLKSEVRERTVRYSPTPTEQIIINNIIALFNAGSSSSSRRTGLSTTINGNLYVELGETLVPTTDVTADPPNIYSGQCVYVQEDPDEVGGDLDRDIYLDALQTIRSSPNITILTNTTNFTATATSTGTGTRTNRNTTAGPTLYSISTTSRNSRGRATTTVIAGAQVVWKTNPYQFIRLATTGSFVPSRTTIKVPVTYRAVFPIPVTNTVTNIATGARVTLTLPTATNGVTFNDHGDGVTTHVSLALPSLTNSGSGGLKWAVQAYTTDVDRADPSKQGGAYASTSSTSTTLLIVEAVDLGNKRTVSFGRPMDRSVGTKPVINVNYNSDTKEQDELTEFTYIFAAIFNAYTGEAITINYDSAENVEPVCNVVSGTSSVCTDVITITSIPARETTVNTVLQTFANLYGQSVFPTVAGSAN